MIASQDAKNDHRNDQASVSIEESEREMKEYIAQ